jgi:sec-independent protein translocase protein TatB
MYGPQADRWIVVYSWLRQTGRGVWNTRSSTGIAEPTTGRKELTQMFDIGPTEFLVLGVLAVIVFGPDKLPEMARKAAKAIKYVRGLAGNAQNQLRSELGADFDDLDFRDLNPKTFVTKHLLSDVEPLVSNVKSDLDNISSLSKDTVSQASTAIADAKATATRKEISTGHGVTATVVPALAAPTIRTPFDPDAT